MRRHAVSLVEVVVVVVILGVLAVILWPALQSARQSDRAASVLADATVRAEGLGSPLGAVPGQGPSEPSSAEAKRSDAYQADGAGMVGATVDTSDTRKIIYRAQIELAVEDFAGSNDRVMALIKQFGGYLADSMLTGTSGETRRGIWKIRVPVARFEEFVGAAKGLGELITAGTTSQDVSEEYYDVDARIRNKTKEEQRLLALLEERPGDLKDVIAIERELSRVREELERMQGRMRVLSDLTSLTTVQLTITEIRDYQPAETPTLATRVRRSFQESVEAIVESGEALLVGAVAVAPWLPILMALFVPLYYLVRRVRRYAARAMGANMARG
jgi:prepilin-type N-terminal cleavage/methylation domain-containing protein